MEVKDMPFMMGRRNADRISDSEKKVKTRIVIDPDTHERHVVEYDLCGVCGDIATVGTHYPPDFTMDEDFCTPCFNKTKTAFNRSN